MVAQAAVVAAAVAEAAVDAVVTAAAVAAATEAAAAVAAAGAATGKSRKAQGFVGGRVYLAPAMGLCFSSAIANLKVLSGHDFSRAEIATIIPGFSR